MMKIRKASTIAMAAAMVTLISASSVLADTTSNSSVHAPKFPQAQSGGVNGGLMTPANGGSNQGPNNGGPTTALDALVTAGTITQAQETAIQTAIQTAMSTATKSQAGLQTALDTLVTAGTITQAQETAIETAITPPTNGGSNQGTNS